MDPLKTGKVIMNARKRLNMTQKDLADKLFISDKAVSKWERGLSFPDISVLIPLSEILNVNLNDLLKGEEMKEKQDDTILKETIRYTNKKNKKTKKIFLTIIVLLVIISIILLGSLIKAKKTVLLYNKPEPGYRFDSINKDYSLLAEPYKVAVKDKGDGWYCEFIFDNLESELHSYNYGCYNLKYQEISGFNNYQFDKEKNKYFISDVNVPKYINNIKYQEELDKIFYYFHDRQFDSKITENDLIDLDITIIDKKEVVELFNKALDSETIDTYGKYLETALPIYHTEYKAKDGKTYIVGYHIDWPVGIIRTIEVDVIAKDGKSKDKTLSNKLKKIKEYILDSQEFDLPDDLKEDKDVKELLNNFNQIKEIVKSKKIGIRGNVIRYITNEKEMEGQYKEEKK